MKKNILFAAMLATCFSASAQTKDGGISEQMLREIQKEQKAEGTDRSLAPLSLCQKPIALRPSTAVPPTL